MDSVLRPRDIQARIRAGEAPEDVAAAAQTTVDRIMGFATPVLAERAYQAQLAQRASVRRRAATGHVGNLGAAVTSHLETLDVDPESVEWDAWRREDGRWTVVAAFLAGGEHRQAAFTYDAAGRFVVADDDEARTLVGERTATSPDTGAPALADVLPEQPAPGEPTGDDAQTALGDDAIHLVTGRRPVPAAEPEAEVTVDLTDTSSAVRGAGPASADADWIATQASERPAPPPAAESTPPSEPHHEPEPDAPPPDGGTRSDPWDSPNDDETVEGDAREEEQEAADTLFEVPAPDQPEPRTPARSAKARGRASVPSWDEIMFGTPKSE